MNGPHDMGGVAGFGPVIPEPNEPAFHGEWERRIFAMVLAMGRPGGWNIDQSRSAREQTPGYLSKTYFQIWLAGLEKLMAERGMVAKTEVDAGHATGQPRAVAHILKAGDVPATLMRGGPTSRPNTGQPAFTIGQRVRAKRMDPPGHTRLPRYVRGHVGTIQLNHGCHVFADACGGRGRGAAISLYRPLRCARAVGRGGEPGRQRLGRRLAELSGGAVTIIPDLSVLPAIPRDDDGPVFREPWEARAFAMAVSLNARGVFAWTEWAAALADEIRADGGTSDYYTLWLRALERLVQEKGVATAAALRDTAEAWKHAAEHTPHGQPIELHRH